MLTLAHTLAEVVLPVVAEGVGLMVRLNEAVGTQGPLVTDMVSVIKPPVDLSFGPK